MNMSNHEMNRREALYRLGLLSLAGMTGCGKPHSNRIQARQSGPTFFFAGDEAAGLRTVAHVRRFDPEWYSQTNLGAHS